MESCKIVQDPRQNAMESSSILNKMLQDVYKSLFGQVKCKDKLYARPYELNSNQLGTKTYEIYTGSYRVLDNPP